jgi:hypothetical protein
MELSHIFSVIISIIGIFLLGMTYTYIDKLEKTGCECARHPYRNFIKGYTLFAIIYIALMFMIPVSMAVKMGGKSAALLYMVANLLFVVVSIVFFICSIIYIRYLMKEKCKCSEDIRREVLYIWSILEVVYLALVAILPILVFLVAGIVGLGAGAIELVGSKESLVKDSVINPLKSAKRIPKAVRDIPKSFKKFKK